MAAEAKDPYRRHGNKAAAQVDPLLIKKNKLDNNKDLFLKNLYNYSLSMKNDLLNLDKVNILEFDFDFIKLSNEKFNFNSII